MGQVPGTSFAIAGKGGTGKTTISGLLISYLVNNRGTRVFAVDADPSMNLGFILGVDVKESLGDIREETLENISSFPPGMTKSQYIDYRINQAVQELDRFDLLSMGRSEGPGCYCYLNRLLRTALDTLSKNYPFIIMDCEAGMEHVSRRTSRGIDHLVAVSDLSIRGLDVALRISLLADTLGNRIGVKHLIINRYHPTMEKEFMDKANEIKNAAGFNTLTIIPEDNELVHMDVKGKSIFDLDTNGPASLAMKKFIEKEILR